MQRNFEHIIGRAILQRAGDGFALLLPIDAARGDRGRHPSGRIARHAGLITAGLLRIRAVADIVQAVGEQRAEFTDAGVPTIADQAARRGEALFTEVATL